MSPARTRAGSRERPQRHRLPAAPARRRAPEAAPRWAAARRSTETLHAHEHPRPEDGAYCEAHGSPSPARCPHAGSHGCRLRFVARRGDARRRALVRRVAGRLRGAFIRSVRSVDDDPWRTRQVALLPATSRSGVWRGAVRLARRWSASASRALSRTAARLRSPTHTTRSRSFELARRRRRCPAHRAGRAFLGALDEARSPLYAGPDMGISVRLAESLRHVPCGLAAHHEHALRLRGVRGGLRRYSVTSSTSGSWKASHGSPPRGFPVTEVAAGVGGVGLLAVRSPPGGQRQRLSRLPADRGRQPLRP